MASCKYLPGTCYTCQKCLYCFKPSLRNPCTCPKEKRRTRVKTPQQGQQIYQRVFKPNQPFPLANQFLFKANIEFGYDSNFKEQFSFTFCSACNSKNQRLRNKDKKGQAKNDDVLELIILDDSSKEDDDKDNGRNDGKDDNRDDDYDNDNGDGDENDDNDGGDDDEDDDNDDGDGDMDDNDDNGNSDEDEDEIDEIKVQIIVKSKSEVSTAKILNIRPINYYDTKEKIHLTIQKILGKKIKSNGYTISYKIANARGPSNILEDELDFDEFIVECKKVILSGKKMSIIVAIKDDKTKKTALAKRHKKVIYFSICKLKAKLNSKN